MENRIFPNASNEATVMNADQISENTTLRQITVKVGNNQQAVQLLTDCIGNGAELNLVTPRVDVGNHPYYWIGVRKGNTEFDFKLLLNSQIEAYVKAFLTGTEEQPQITNFEPDGEVLDQTEWLKAHKTEYATLADSRVEELNLSDGRAYFTEKLVFPRGKVIYPSLIIDNAMSLLNN